MFTTCLIFPYGIKFVHDAVSIFQSGASSLVNRPCIILELCFCF